ncbi:hypothetical protein SLE2022_309420 [Rubroshorea leprosula]
MESKQEGEVGMIGKMTVEARETMMGWDAGAMLVGPRSTLSVCGFVDLKVNSLSIFFPLATRPMIGMPKARSSLRGKERQRTRRSRG